MKTNKEYMLRDIAGEWVLIPTGLASQRLNGMIQLTDTAAFIWRQVDIAKNLQEIIMRVTEEFEVEEETAVQDVWGFLEELYIRDMVQEIPELEEQVRNRQEQK